MRAIESQAGEFIIDTVENTEPGKVLQKGTDRVKVVFVAK